MTCDACDSWRTYAGHLFRERQFLYDRLAEVDPDYAATKAAWRATQADPEKMAWLAEQARRLDERTAGQR